VRGRGSSIPNANQSLYSEKKHRGARIWLPFFLFEEPVSKCSILLKVKSKIPDFERGMAKILATGIHLVFRGLKFEPRHLRDVPPDADLPAVRQAGIEQKGTF